MLNDHGPCWFLRHHWRRVEKRCLNMYWRNRSVLLEVSICNAGGESLWPAEYSCIPVIPAFSTHTTSHTKWLYLNTSCMVTNLTRDTETVIWKKTLEYKNIKCMSLEENLQETKKNLSCTHIHILASWQILVILQIYDVPGSDLEVSVFLKNVVKKCNQARFDICLVYSTLYLFKEYWFWYWSFEIVWELIRSRNKKK